MLPDVSWKKIQRSPLGHVVDAIEVFSKIVWNLGELGKELAVGCANGACEAVGFDDVELLDHTAVRH